MFQSILQRMVSPAPSVALHPITRTIFVSHSRLQSFSPRPVYLSTAIFSTFENDGDNSPMDKPMTKGDLYGHDELLRLLSIHNMFSEEYAVPSLEDTTNIYDHFTSEHHAQPAPTSVHTNTSFLDEETKWKIQRIRAIASDVDGTLLSSRQTLHPRTKLAVKYAIELASKKKDLDYFFLATGKSRKGALTSLGLEIKDLINANNVPGVYLQGLHCLDGNGNVVFEKKLPLQAVAAVEALLESQGLSIVAYDGDSLYTTIESDIVRHLHTNYGEPLPMELSKLHLEKLVDYAPGFHKLLLMDDDTVKLREVIRPQIENLAKQYHACVTQALPTMLELLPEGCSKAVGVSKLCEALNLDMSVQLLALGDAENDVDMLKRAAIGVAVGNACPKAKAAADFVMTETNDEGAAGAAMELFAFKQQY